jgi:hypothetical protein
MRVKTGKQNIHKQTAKQESRKQNNNTGETPSKRWEHSSGPLRQAFQKALSAAPEHIIGAARCGGA